MSQSATTSTSTFSDLNFGSFFALDALNNSNSNNLTLDNIKRKKPVTNLTCAHCQKAQLTCDGSRPCQRCIKRDLATTCTDGPHKRDKQDSYEEFSSPTAYDTDGNCMSTHFLDTSQLLNFSLADLGFGSETAGLEYGVIGNMLQNPMDLISTTTNSTTAPTTAITATTTTPATATATTTTSPSPVPASSSIMTTPTPTFSYSTNTPASSILATNSGAMTPSIINTASPATNSSISTSLMTPTSGQLDSMTPMSYNTPTSSSTAFSPNGLYSFSPNTMMLNHTQHQHPSQFQLHHSHSTPNQPPNRSPVNGNKREPPTTTTTSAPASNSRRKGSNGNTPEQVYNSVQRPFNYAEGFHYLIQYVRQKMNRDDLMRISRALALIRPSFLALIMNLTEEDLVFMEKCFQRTLLEYEKLISFSGTPTVVWRRTGEICLAGKEFSLLTQWTKDALLGKKTYIYELMDNQSAVEYWEQFSTHAFDNTDKACIHSCILRTPQQRPVPCTFCFTIKRDIFDLPSVIVGNFLPILS
ncbi:hypothetical protein [Absidia glauca]|uniref:Zn(2)-C6 fungal-type domain-containing protein n=1 Tax=Absidia glauca TaxID=4829 RepID=A0A163JLX6_ABSGL|nr:hypothetical protein [Absidia glauca]